MPALRTPPCVVCSNTSIVGLTNDEYQAFIVERKFAQDALPTRNADFRELLITGTHDGCWMTLYYTSPGAQDDFEMFIVAVMRFLGWLR